MNIVGSHAGGGRSVGSAAKSHGKATLRPCDLGADLISFSFRLDSEQRLIRSSVASVRRKAVDSVSVIVVPTAA
jgi:hypothetical protein